MPDTRNADSERMDKIRLILVDFNWDCDDRQLALEAIERIAFGNPDA